MIRSGSPPKSSADEDPRRKELLLPALPVELIRSELVLCPDSSRVVIKPYFEEVDATRDRILETVLAYDEEQAEALLREILKEFEGRHIDFRGLLNERYRQIAGLVELPGNLTETQRMLLGGHFLSEYALESAALFNPSIVPHPNQSGVSDGSLRIVMSLRSIGEGHISSIEFRTGMVDGLGNVSIDPPSNCVSAAMRTSNPVYHRRAFRNVLRDIEATHPLCKAIIDDLGQTFTRPELDSAINSVIAASGTGQGRIERDIVAELQFLAECNYTVKFPTALPLSERILMPQSPSERNGIEDARFVKFQDDDPGTPVYYATYTAYNGRVTLPQLIETNDFTEFRMSTLNGRAATNKGMAIFPRKIKGRYVALTRSDGCNNYLSKSEDLYYWDEAALLTVPRFPWEILKVGNCGSPIETDRGWLVITHGVGAMRKYCIGAMLLDLEDPSRVISRLPEPIVTPNENEREGYVPNVVYTCGALAHNGWLVLPYAMGDYATTVGRIHMDELLDALVACQD